MCFVARDCFVASLLAMTVVKYMQKNEITGMAVSKGKAKGILTIIKTREDIDRVNDKEIVVITDIIPEIRIALKKASGAIISFGGITSHPAKAVRETNTPCVVVADADLSLLKEGSMVEIDGGKGTIKII